MSDAIYLGYVYTESHLLFIWISNFTGRPVAYLAALLFRSGIHFLCQSPVTSAVTPVGCSGVTLWGLLTL